MKKIFLVVMLMFLGNFVSVFAKESSEAVVTVRATLVDEELVIGGVNNKPMIIDFKDLKNGNLDFMVSYTGIENSNSKVDISLKQNDIALTNENSKSINSNINLTKENSVLKGKKSKIVNSIYGNLKNDCKNLENGLYAGVTELNITVIPM